jgi:hypothetical protein
LLSMCRSVACLFPTELVYYALGYVVDTS